METSMDLTQGLPHDLLADVLGRLHPSPRSLAASRCVSKAWCTVVDAHRLLSDLLPHPLAGIFVHVGQGTPPKHFSLVPPTEIAAFDYLDTQDAECLTIRQHCNGLLLLGDEEVRVLNPATRQWATLARPPPMFTPGLEDVFRAKTYMGCHDQYLVFDPTVSPDYENNIVKSYIPNMVSGVNLNYDAGLPTRASTGLGLRVARPTSAAGGPAPSPASASLLRLLRRTPHIGHLVRCRRSRPRPRGVPRECPDHGVGHRLGRRRLLRRRRRRSFAARGRTAAAAAKRERLPPPPPPLRLAAMATAAPTETGRRAAERVQSGHEPQRIGVGSPPPPSLGGPGGGVADASRSSGHGWGSRPVDRPDVGMTGRRRPPRSASSAMVSASSAMALAISALVAGRRPSARSAASATASATSASAAPPRGPAAGPQRRRLPPPPPPGGVGGTSEQRAPN
ncbi:hypothetical protein QYE76_019426 [Lolium multiflorum]|uniref:F-box domain-containing protein n=1 Tax=Lolium multiflorum TaxID=4521 RepID=A0AAD8VP33_LOLMU|nr:hypothetical protein QYE76_019426 [Lolium multiflorum]